MRCWYEYTFRRLMIMAASPFLGWPVCLWIIGCPPSQILQVRKFGGDEDWGGPPVWQGRGLKWSRGD